MSALVRTPESISLFLSINKGWLAKATSVSLDAELAKEETTSLESAGFREYQPTLYGASFSADLMAAVSSTGYTAYSGASVTSGMTAYVLFEELKNRRTVPACLKIDNSNFQKGSVVLEKVSLKADTGKIITFSVSGTYTGTVVKSSAQ